MGHSRRLLCRTTWLIFILANAILLFGMSVLPFAATIAVWICMLLTLMGLLVGYRLNICLLYTSRCV